MSNFSIWNRSSIVDYYLENSFKSEGENQHFKNCDVLIKNGFVLDIGIGGGRTTKILFPIAKKYIGIDYSEPLVKAAKKQFPEADLLEMDARDLSYFEDEVFDVVVFSFNGIDYIDKDDREKVFKEVSRILKKRGRFIFSSHNRNLESFNKFTSSLRHEKGLTKLKSLLKFIIYLPRHYNMLSKQIIMQDYAIINDSAHGFSLMTFYISKEEQEIQCERNNLRLISTLAQNGSSEEVEFKDSDFLEYLAEKS